MTTEIHEYLKPERPPLMMKQIFLDHGVGTVYAIAGDGSNWNSVWIEYNDKVYPPSMMMAAYPGGPKGVTPGHRRVEYYQSAIGPVSFFFLYDDLFIIENSEAAELLKEPDLISIRLLRRSKRNTLIIDN